MSISYLVYNSVLIIACTFAYFAEHGNAVLYRLFNRPFSALSSKVPLALHLGNERHFRLFCRFMVFLALWIPASLRYGVGGDYFSYVNIFNRNSYAIFNFRTLESGWVILNKAIHFVGLPAQWVFVFSSFLIYFPISFIIKRKNYFYSIVFYFLLEFYFESFNTIRQQIAVSFCICAVTALEFKKNIRFFAWVFAAFLFHQSALFVLPFFPLKYIKFKRNIFPIIIAIVGVFIILKVDVYGYVMSILGKLQVKYVRYALPEAPGQLTNVFDTGLGFLAKIFPLLITLFMLPWITKKYPQKAFVVNLMIIYILIWVLSRQYYMMRRVRMIFDFVPILTIGFAIQEAGKYKKILAIVMICASLLVFQKDNYDRSYHSIFLDDAAKEEVYLNSKAYKLGVRLLSNEQNEQIQ